MEQNKILKVDDIKNLSLDMMIDAVRNGYRIEGAGNVPAGNRIKSLASCVSSIVQGTTKYLTFNLSGGTAPYKLEFLADGVVTDTWTGMTAGTKGINRVFNESVGNHSYTARITDSCSTPQVVSDTPCTISITSALGTITLSGCTSAISIGTSCTITAQCKNSAGTVVSCPALTWTSSNPLVASVNSSGVVTGWAVGTANITVSASGYTTSLARTVTVTAAALGTISITGCLSPLPVGSTCNLTASCQDYAGNPVACSALTWSTTDSTIAGVSTSGQVYGGRIGTAGVKASASGYSDSNTVTINVVAAACPAPSVTLNIA